MNSPLREFPTGRVAVVVVDLDPNARGLECGRDVSRGVRDGGLVLVLLRDRDDHDLDGREVRRKSKPSVVAVRHDDACDQNTRAVSLLAHTETIKRNLPPMSRVETPQDDWCTCLVLPSWSRNVVSNALEKFCPRLCDVPA